MIVSLILASMVTLVAVVVSILLFHSVAGSFVPIIGISNLTWLYVVGGNVAWVAGTYYLTKWFEKNRARGQSEGGENAA